MSLLLSRFDNTHEKFATITPDQKIRYVLGKHENGLRLHCSSTFAPTTTGWMHSLTGSWHKDPF